MANQYYNFYYDPTRQGYDLDTWSTTLGAPIVVANHLKLDEAGCIHYASLLRGDFSFSLNLQTPAAGDVHFFGLALINRDSFVAFSIVDDVFTAEVSLGALVGTETITWNADWANTDTVYRIKWEAGTARFYIGGQLKATIGDAVPLGTPTVVVPGDPLSITLSSDSITPILVNYIEAKDVQSATL